jgi:hypothetical protein
MRRMRVDDQKQLAISADSQQSTEKLDEFPAVQPTGEHHEPQLPEIADRRDHVAPKPFARGIDHRCLSTRGVTAADLIIRPQTHLITP